jgi:aromatic ring-opening dioxygenase catalytic subunit (LigB family)
VVVISGHWETPQFAVTTNAHPPLYYDYYGFPPHTYELKYPAPGNPALAQRVRDLLGKAGFATAADGARGFDHGVFIPFMLVLPDADVPIVQLSVRADLDPAAHLAAGRALAPLRDDGVLIVGSGMSFHNMRAFGNPAAGPVSDTFDAWLTRAVEAPPRERDHALAHWAEAPAGRESHPRAEHLIPLLVAAGAGGSDAGHTIFTDRVMGVTVSGHRFG